MGRGTGLSWGGAEMGRSLSELPREITPVLLVSVPCTVSRVREALRWVGRPPGRDRKIQAPRGKGYIVTTGASGRAFQPERVG